VIIETCLSSPCCAACTSFLHGPFRMPLDRFRTAGVRPWKPIRSFASARFQREPSGVPGKLGRYLRIASPEAKLSPKRGSFREAGNRCYGNMRNPNPALMMKPGLEIKNITTEKKKKEPFREFAPEPKTPIFSSAPYQRLLRHRAHAAVSISSKPTQAAAVHFRSESGMSSSPQAIAAGVR